MELHTERCRNWDRYAFSVYPQSESDSTIVAIPKTASSPKIQFKPRASSSPAFMGRENHLANLKAFFSTQPYKSGHKKYLAKFGSLFGTQPHETLPRKCFLLYGMGGVGKTQICLKFTEESSDL